MVRPIRTGISADIRLLELRILERRFTTAFAMALSLASTAFRAVGATTWRSFYTDFTPSTPCTMSLARGRAPGGGAARSATTPMSEASAD